MVYFLFGKLRLCWVVVVDFDIDLLMGDVLVVYISEEFWCLI